MYRKRERLHFFAEYADNIFMNRERETKRVADRIMEDNRKEQVEALEVLTEFNERLIKNLKIVIRELSGARLEDTDKFIKGIIDAMNWEIEVMNGTMDLLNADKVRVDREAFDQRITAVGEAVAAKDDVKLAEAFENVLPCFERLGVAAAEVI